MDGKQNIPRDTQFAGFAELLILQFAGLSVRYKDWPDWRELDRQMKLAIAQRAYDLVEHALERAPVIEYEYTADHIPDMTKWPEESKTNE